MSDSQSMWDTGFQMSKYIIYECPSCDYLDSDKELAASHCIDDKATFW